MKYCLNSNVSDIYLRQADQIFFVPDGPALSELLEKYTQAIIFVPPLAETWDILNAYKSFNHPNLNEVLKTYSQMPGNKKNYISPLDAYKT